MTDQTPRTEALDRHERIERILATRKWPTGYPLTDREAALLRKNTGHVR
jgi:hypothetical protein